jgi:hypothetical protein
MSREVQQPTVNEDGYESHPAWGMIGASRVSSSPPATLFDSDIKHQHFVTVRISAAERKRSLNRDWLHPQEQDIEVAMSEAQWASFVSSMNTGSGVPCTIEQRGRERMPAMPHEPRLAESMDEVRNAGTKALAHIREAFAKVEEKPNKGNIKDLRHAIENAPANMGFAAESLSEHAENVVQKARADIEAMVLSKAAELGVDPADVTPQLTSGEEKS